MPKKNKKAIEGQIVKSKKETAIVPEQNFLPSFPTKSQIAEYEAFLNNYNDFVDRMLKDKVDYGVVPGVDKPSLFKPGAEKLEKLFSYRHKKVQVEKVIEPDFIKYTYRTEVYNKAGERVATCEGTCNSKEKKYRYYTVFDNEATPEQKKNGRLLVRKSKRTGKEYRIYQVEKDDFYDLENTIMKMAQKRSYVGVILEATNSSGRFTQDVEDMDLGSVSGVRNAPTGHRTPAKEFNGPNGYQTTRPGHKTPKTGEFGEPLDDGKDDEDIPVIDADQTPSESPHYECHDCARIIGNDERDFSLKFYGKQLCRNCQRNHKKLSQ